MRNLYLGLLTVLSAFVFTSDAYAQGAIHGVASYAQHKHSYLIDKNMDYSKDDQLRLQANFSRFLGDWTISVVFSQDSRNQTLNITINDFEKVPGQDHVWQNAQEIWLYGQTFRLRAVVDQNNRYLTLYIEDPEMDSRQNEPEILGYHTVMQASAHY
ncbi:hypothetical protein MRY82_00050 [bacterium]|nr:hypothetical protein [bacterium]